MGNIPSVVSGQLATAAQYNALQSGLNPLVENSYTSWALKSGFPLTVALATSGSFYNDSFQPIVDEINGILYIDGGIFNYSMVIIDIVNATPIASGTTALPSASANRLDTDLPLNANQFSRNVLYYAWIDKSNNIHIYKAGQSLSTIALPNPPFVPSTGSAAVAGNPLGPYMSPTGKYIMVWPYNNDTGYTIDLYVYEGQP